MYWDWFGPWHMGWGGGWGWVFPVLMMVLMIVACVFLMSRMMGGHAGMRGSGGSSALEILGERFAKGEISKEEFEEKRTLLVRRT